MAAFRSHTRLKEYSESYNLLRRQSSTAFLRRQRGKSENVYEIQSICLACRYHALTWRPSRESRHPKLDLSRDKRFNSSSSSRLPDDAVDDTSSTSRSKSPKPIDPSLPSYSESRRTRLSRRFTNVMDHVQTNIFTASQRINDLTGYTGIDALKKSIEIQEELVFSTREQVAKAKAAYREAISLRSGSQREVNDLLQRRASWTPVELERFTSLYRSDHANEMAEQQAQQVLAEAERTADEATSELSKSILARYHEEQIWSDKIRRMSTWGTWGLMGVNVLLFLIFQVLVEPWRRARLVKGFDEKVKEALASNGSNDRLFEGGNDRSEAVVSAALEAPKGIQHSSVVVPQTAGTFSSSTSGQTQLSEERTDGDLLVQSNGLKSFVKDSFSDRTISIRRLDQTILVFESAAVGATFVAAIVGLWRRA